MADRLAGKRCLITGAGQGIGRETALMFAREGASVLATDINEQTLDELARTCSGIETEHLDVTAKSSIEQLFALQPRFDVVFNCAGYVHHGTILDCSEDDWRQSFAINVDGMYWICKAVLPAMVDAGGGSIINMSSVASSVKGVVDRFVYGATKAAVIGMTKAIAADFVSRGVRCNAICPATVNTPSLEERVAALGGNIEENWRAFVARQPMGRIGEPQEIAALVVYLASDESAFTTGAIHVIDGGWVC